MANPRLCYVPECSNPIRSRGWCSAHYERWRNFGDPMRGGPLKTSKGEVRRYYESVVLAYEGDDCLTWPYNRDPKGYAQMHCRDGRTNSVSRRLCEDVNGAPPTTKHEAAHSCGCGHLGCVTRSHLSWKTSSENKADMVLHGTAPRGEKQGSSKLTAKDVLSIRTSPILGNVLAARYGVSKSSISRIRNGKMWSWL